MKNSIILLLLPFIFKAQTVPSSCNAHDSIQKKYRTDSDRLAVKRVYKINSTYKDSITISKTISKSYQDVLLAVYNATAIPARDTIVRILNIHTNPSTELNSLTIKGNPAYQWMMNIKNNTYPTGDPSIDYLLTKYYLQESGYYQSQGYDLVRFRTDTNINILPLTASFTVIAGVSDSDPDVAYNDTKDIVDSIGTGFTFMTYSYGWGTCENGCDYRRFWKLKVFSDCSVQYMGTTGDPLFTGIPDHEGLNAVKIYPNPAKDQLTIKSETAFTRLELVNLFGQRIKSWESTGTEQKLDIGELEPGIYFLTLQINNSSRTIKMVKD